MRKISIARVLAAGLGLTVAAACSAPTPVHQMATSDSVLRAQYAASDDVTGIDGEDATRMMRQYRKEAVSEAGHHRAEISNIGTSRQDGIQTRLP